MPKKGGRNHAKQKGSRFERATCKQLSIWVSNGARTDCFWRSAMSGGRATRQIGSERMYTAQVGDISAIHPLGHDLLWLFVIDTKHYKDLQAHRLVFGNSGRIIEEYSKLQRDVRGAFKNDGVPREPLGVFRQNSFPTLAITSRRGFKILKKGDVDNELSATCVLPSLDVVICRFDDVLSLVDFQLLRRLCSDEQRNQNRKRVRIHERK